MKKAIILCGAQGAGKTSWVERNFPVPLATEDLPLSSRAATVCSADLVRLARHGGKYVYDPEETPEIYAQCFRHYLDALKYENEHARRPVIVDNTNSTLLQLAPYVLAARAYGFEIEIHVWDPSLDGAIISGKRNVHGVPEQVVWATAKAVRETLANWPADWPAPIIESVDVRDPVQA